MDRRGFLTGLGVSIVAAPAIVRATSLMPIRLLRPSAALEQYGRSPLMAELASFREFNEYMRRLHSERHAWRVQWQETCQMLSRAPINQHV